MSPHIFMGAKPYLYGCEILIFFGKEGVMARRATKLPLGAPDVGQYVRKVRAKRHKQFSLQLAVLRAA
jgi:hypothetical protein